MYSKIQTIRCDHGANLRSSDLLASIRNRDRPIYPKPRYIDIEIDEMTQPILNFEIGINKNFVFSFQ